MSRRRKTKKKRKTLDLYLVAALIYIFAWSLAFFIAWVKFKLEPSTLEAAILAPGITEMICTAVIQRGKIKYQSNDQTTENPGSGNDGSDSFYYDDTPSEG